MRDDELSNELRNELLSEVRSDPAPERIAELRAAVVEASAGTLLSGQPNNTAASLDAPSAGGSLGERSVATQAKSKGRWLSLTAAALLSGIGLGIYLGANPNGSAEGEIEFDGTIDGVGDFSGQLSVVKTGIGRVITLDTEDLQILPKGEFYEVWFVAPDDTGQSPNRISAGTFHPDDNGRSKVVFAAAVDPTLFPVVEITAEPSDGDPAVTGPVVMTVAL